MDQNAVGEGIQIQYKGCGDRLSTKTPKGRQSIHHAGPLRAGYTAETLLQLNRVRISLQVVFMLDILTVSGNRINAKILSCCPPGEAYSNMRWPQERPTNADIQLWRNAMLSIYPSRCKTSSIGRFLSNMHIIWCWSWCEVDLTLCHLDNDGKTEDVFISGQKPNRYHYSRSQLHSKQQVVCSVLPTLDGGHWRLLSTALCAVPTPSPSMFLEVLETWGNTWLWEYMTVTGGVTWVIKSIFCTAPLSLSQMGPTSGNSSQNSVWRPSSLNAARGVEK
jgi:hypothetical protein